MEFRTLKKAPRALLVLGMLICFYGLTHNSHLDAVEKKSADSAFLSESGLRHVGFQPEKGLTQVSFSFKVIPALYAISFRLQSASTDLEIEVLNSLGTVVWQAKTSSWNEKLFLYRMGSPALEDGTYTLRVELPDAVGQASHGSMATPQDPSDVQVQCDLSTQFFMLNDFVPLKISTLSHDNLEPDHAMYKAFCVEVPSATKQVRIDIFGSQTDTDLFGEYNVPISDPREATYSAQTWRSRESIVIDTRKPSVAKSRTSFVYIVVLSEMDDVAADFNIVASIGDTTPPELLALPDFTPNTPSGAPSFLQKSLDASVELIADNGGGSGCVISPGGWILTNLHVLRQADGTIEKEVTVGFSQDFRQIPDSQFWARVVETDESRDIALLKIDSGFYRQKIPSTYHFPSMTIASAGALKIGDPLYFSGYPTIGGLGNRATITCTQGIVSGFQTRQDITYLKTGAVISPGNSGGAALDQLGRCIGVPTIVVGSGPSQIAYILPLDIVPKAWLVEAGVSF